MLAQTPVQKRPTATAPDDTRSLTVAFAAVDKRALGIAVGIVVGLGIFGLTIVHRVLRPASGLPLGLLSQYFLGYNVTWAGAVVGFFWGFFTGFVCGWF